MKTLLHVLIICSIFISCAPINNEYNKKTFNHDIKDLKETGVPESDIQLIKFYIELKISRKQNIDSTLTYHNILDSAKTEFVRMNLLLLNREEKNYKQYIKNVAVIDSMKGKILLSLLSKKYDFDDYREMIHIDFNIINMGKKDIRAFVGVITFNDIFGDEIKKHELRCYTPIAAQKSIQYSTDIFYNPAIESNLILLNTATENISLELKPISVMFTDGTILETIPLPNYGDDYNLAR